MQPLMSFSQAIVQMLVQLAPTFVVVCVMFIIFSWLRVLVDAMSGRGL